MSGTIIGSMPAENAARIPLKESSMTEASLGSTCSSAGQQLSYARFQRQASMVISGMILSGNLSRIVIIRKICTEMRHKNLAAHCGVNPDTFAVRGIKVCEMVRFGWKHYSTILAQM